MSRDLADAYNQLGWPVFPCRAGEDVDPTTGEVLAPKTPYTSNGLKGASLLPRILDRWWRDWPDAMVGIPTGEKIGAWVLDVDFDPDKGIDGYASLDALLLEHGDFPPTAAARTPRGGTHYYFKHVPGVRNRGALGPGLDVRGEGGYVLAPGSVMRDGRSYHWITDHQDILPAPDWLLDLVVVKHRSSTPASYTPLATATGGNERYVDAAVQAELIDLAAAPMGNRNNKLNDASFALGQFVGAGAVTEAYARDMLEGIARQWGRDWARCVKTINNGLTAGMRIPRDIPEPDFRRDGTPVLDFTGFVERARAKLAAASPEDAASGPDNGADGKDAPSVPPAPDCVPTPVVRATPFSWVDPASLPRREFVYGTHLIRKYVSVTVSPGGVGKTSLSIAEVLAMVTGRPLLGDKPPQKLKVWLFNAEDPRDEMERRIMAACLHFKLKPEDIGDRLFLDTGREQELVVAYDDKRGVKIAVPVVEAIVETIIANGIDVMIIDPFVSTHGVSENDNGAIDKVAKLWAKIADQTNTAIEIVHHVRKTNGSEVTVDDARGAVSLIAAARSARVLNRMTEDQAAEYCVPIGERYSYVHVERGKASHSALSARMDWRKLVSVPLGNGRSMTQPQDHVGVMTCWTPPTTEEVASEVTDQQMENLLSLLGVGGYKERPNAKPWAGEAVATALGLDIDDKSVRKRVGRLLGQWLEEGVLRVESRMDPSTRKLGSFVLAA